MESNIDFISRRLAELPPVPDAPQVLPGLPIPPEDDERANARSARAQALEILMYELENDRGALLRIRGDFVMMRLEGELVRSEIGAEDALNKWLGNQLDG